MGRLCKGFIRKKVRKLKKDGMLSAENFGKYRLEKLGLELLAFSDSLTNDPNRKLSWAEIGFLNDVENVIDAISLLLSDKTDFGYIEKVSEKFREHKT